MEIKTFGVRTDTENTIRWHDRDHVRAIRVGSTRVDIMDWVCFPWMAFAEDRDTPLFTVSRVFDSHCSTPMEAAIDGLWYHNSK